MEKKRKQNQFNKVRKTIAEGLLFSAKLQLRKKKWGSVFVHTLWPPTGPTEGGLQKFRAKLATGTVIALSMPIDASTLINKAWKLQSGLFSGTWYGLKFTVFPNGEFETEFDFDPDCLDNDQTFFDGCHLK